MNFPISDSNSFSCLRFARFANESAQRLQSGASFSLRDSVAIGGELLFESKEDFREGNFILRSQSAAVFFNAVRLSNDSYNNFSLGDLVEVKVPSNSIVRVGEKLEITSAASVDCRLLVRPRREAKLMQFDYNRALNWQVFIRTVREFFQDQGFIEALTPSLVTNPGMEPELEPLATEVRNAGRSKRLFLPTSPELHLKQVLSAGFTEIFEIKTCYRNEESTPHHQPEFQMLEWYRSFTNLDSIERDLVELLKKTLARTERATAEIRVERASMAELFKSAFHFDLTPRTSKDDLVRLAQQNDIEVSTDDTWNDVFHRLFVSKIEENLGRNHPLIVFNFPPTQAALARLTSDGWADRFELYWNGLEIANAFHELNDPDEQLRRFKADQQKRLERGRTPLVIDQNFMRALEAGLPPCAGIALGLDRLFMALYGLKDIREARFFAAEHQS